MSFYSTYDLIDLVRDDGIKTFNAVEIATGRPVLVHLFTRPGSPEMQALLSMLPRLSPEAKAEILAQGDHEGTPYVVTAPVTSHAGFREWLVNSKRTAEAAARGPQPTPGPDVASSQPSQDDPFAALFKKPVASSTPPAPPAPQAGRPPSLPSTADFRHLIETPTTKKPAFPAGNRAAGPPSSEGTRLMTTAEYQSAFPAQQETPAPATPAAKSDATPGEFTRMFQRPAGIGTAAEEHKPGEFTRMFQAPASVPAQPVPEKTRPGEFTRMFQASGAPVEPEAAAVTSAFQPSSHMRPEPNLEPAPASDDSGEFARFFGGTPAPAAPTSSEPAPQELGEFTKMFQAGGPPASEPLPKEPPAAPATVESGGEFTRMFQTGAMTPVPPAPVTAPPPSPAPAADGGGEFTRMFQAGGSPPPPPAAPPPASSTVATPPEPAGEFTRMFQSGGMPAQPARSSTDRFSSPPAAPTPAAQPPAHQEAGEFTRMFNAPPPPVSPATPHAAPTSGAGEFTRMFESPLSPAPIGPTQGPPDPFGGAKGTITPPQAAPVGEFTKMFGAKDLPPQRATPIGPPLPPPPGSAGATNVFKTMDSAGGFPAAPPQGGGYAPSTGSADFTRMMASPSGGILAEAAAAPEPEKKSAFRTYLPLIIIFGILLVLLIVILIVFAMKKP